MRAGQTIALNDWLILAERTALAAVPPPPSGFQSPTYYLGSSTASMT